MTGTLTITTDGPTNATLPLAWSTSLGGMAVTNTPDAPRSVPAFIRADEAYYWSFRWQEDVREAMEALAAGDYEEFDSDDPNDVVRWLADIDEGDHQN
jgi:hypothetical protein